MTSEKTTAVNKTEQAPFSRLLKMYFYRLVHEKAFWIVFGIISTIGIITALILGETDAASRGKGYGDVFSLTQFAIMGTNFGMYSTYQTKGSQDGINTPILLGFIAVIVVSFFIGREWHNRTFRNQILSGFSRGKIFGASVIVSLAIALANLAAFELFFWLLGLALGVPVFLPNATIPGFSNTGAAFAIAFFMCLLIYLVFAVIACSWAFIIPNSWGALGLLYATIAFFSLLSLIVLFIESANRDTYYQFSEWLLPYQYSAFSLLSFDDAVKIDLSSGYYQTVLVSGRAGALIAKTVISCLVLGGGMGFLGFLSFTKRDLK